MLKTASELWNLLHEAAPFILPNIYPSLHRRVQQALDDGCEQWPHEPSAGTSYRVELFSNGEWFASKAAFNFADEAVKIGKSSDAERYRVVCVKSCETVIREGDCKSRHPNQENDGAV